MSRSMIAAGQKVPRDRISKFYRSRVCSFASLACTKNEVVKMTLSQIKRHFVDGDRLAAGIQSTDQALRL